MSFYDADNIDEEHVIPTLSTPDTYPTVVNSATLRQQQKYHSILIVPMQDLSPDPRIGSPLVRKALRVVEDADPNERFGRINTAPVWLLGDDTPPPSWQAQAPIFAFQISENFLFERFAKSPRQQQVDYFSQTGISDRVSNDYSIFVGNEI